MSNIYVISGKEEVAIKMKTGIILREQWKISRNQ